MASTNKTARPGLNQWVEEDPVLRVDFNADNSKLDAAVSVRAWHRLLGQTVSAAAAAVRLDLLDLDLTQYGGLTHWFAPKTTAGGGGEVSLSVNGGAAQKLFRATGAGTAGLRLDLDLLPGGLGAAWTAPGTTQRGGFALPGLTPDTLRTLELRCGDGTTFAPGTQCRLYGLAL